MSYNETTKKERLQGRVKFPTGGKVREPKGTNRCDSGTDSTVWMEEDTDRWWIIPQPLFVA